jgi:hypothetical protein
VITGVAALAFSMSLAVTHRPLTAQLMASKTAERSGT